MKKILAGVVALLLALPGTSFAQTSAQAVNGFLLAQGSTYGGYTCPAAAVMPCFVQYGAAIPVTGTFSATLGGFTPTSGATANISDIVNTSQDVALPTGADVVVTNKGSVTVYIRLPVGAGTAVATDLPLVAGAAAGFHITTATHISAIAPTGTGTGSTAGQINIQGGSGLATGYGGGSSTGGSGGDASAANQTVVQGVIGAATAPTKMNVTGGVYNSSPLTLTNGQSSAAQYDANGYQKVNIAAGNGSAQGAAIAGQTPSTIAAQTLTSNPTPYTTATTNPVTQDEYGALLTRPYSLGAGLVQGTTSAMTGTTSTSLVAAPGSNLRNYLTHIACVNSHATVGTFITVQDGSGGTALYTLAAAAVFGGASFTFPAPLRQPTANTALFVADVTTGANVICSASGFKAP